MAQQQAAAGRSGAAGKEPLVYSEYCRNEAAGSLQRDVLSLRKCVVRAVSAGLAETTRFRGCVRSRRRSKPEVTVSFRWGAGSDTGNAHSSQRAGPAAFGRALREGVSVYKRLSH